MTTACPRAPRDEENRGKKNNKLILTAKTRRKSNVSYEWKYEMYIFRFETNVSRIEYTPWNSKIKIEANELFFSIIWKKNMTNESLKTV